MRATSRKRSACRPRFSGAVCVALCSSLAGTFAHAQQSTVTGRVEILRQNAAKPASNSANTSDASNVVVWLTPSGSSAVSAPPPLPAQHPQLVQRNKSFEPHVLVIQVGSTVQFPNKDPFFHNVFSLFDGKRFDLGLYEGGSTNSARFDRVGISFLFCNIHPEMNAIVVSVATPYFAVSDHSGRVAMSGVPDGQYLLHAWYERSSPEGLKNLDRPVTISESAHSLPTIQVTDNGDFKLAHKNKYGQDYVPSSGPAYSHP